MAYQSKRYRFGLLLLVIILPCVTLAVKQTQAVSLSPASRVDQPIGTWKKVENPGWSGDSHSWLSATDGWSFTPQPPWGIDFYQWDGIEWNNVQTLDKAGLSYLYGIDIQMLSSSDGWAVAPSINVHYSTFFRWNGTTWQTFQTITDTDISAIDIIGPNEGWAVGIRTCCGAKYYHWNGSTWQQGSYLELKWPVSDISMVSATDGWSVGGSIARMQGQSWSTVASPTSNRLNGVDFVSANDGWIIGDEGTILRWNGSGSWSVVPSPTSKDLNAIEMVSATDGWAVGDEGTIVHWDGAQWTLVASPATVDFHEIDMTAATDGWIPYYDNATSSPGLLHYTVAPPSLTINYKSGSPGSFFTVAGTGFPAESNAIIKTNGSEIGNVGTDESGSLGFLLDTAEADVGAYNVTVEVNPSAIVGFILDADAPLRPQEGSGPVINVPAGIAFTEQLFMPVVLK